MENVEDILERLFSYYKVASVAELSKQINTSQKTISNWKIRNSISAVKKKCRELGIYNQIFGDVNHRISVNSNSGQISGTTTTQTQTNNNLNNIIDNATMGLIEEAYKKAIKNDSLNEFRIYIMSFK
ncbi:helix-turn-helix domain-containing protein [Aliarcobacter skirrowii]|uniref:helix-turn-helix domain-containing protein n=1 Tax=Aliarcobacter skirrowii TaxID=28200 RepID=UPI0029B2F7A6|nr:helix-turn-helix domain-containing protein [Aliarcobacter skirrowii]MDX4060204.1 helix-turn-helix domain-containing protein [Aliarcobacter skirrowii]